MTGAEILSDVVTQLFQTAKAALPVKGVGLVRLDDASRAVLTYVDPFGVTEYRTEIGALPDAVLPGVPVSRAIALDQLEAIPNGLLESRVLHSTFSEEVRRECAVRELIAMPVPQLDASTVLLVGRAESAPLTDLEQTNLDRLAQGIVGLIDHAEGERRDGELRLLRRLEAADRLLPAFFRELDVRQIFDRLSDITKDVL